MKQVAELLSAGPRVIPRLRSPFRRALRHASRRCSRDPWRSLATEWHLRPAEIDRLGWEVGRLTKLQPSRAAGCGGTSAARLKGLQGLEISAATWVFVATKEPATEVLAAEIRALSARWTPAAIDPPHPIGFRAARAASWAPRLGGWLGESASQGQSALPGECPPEAACECG